MHLDTTYLSRHCAYILYGTIGIRRDSRNNKRVSAAEWIDTLLGPSAGSPESSQSIINRTSELRPGCRNSCSWCMPNLVIRSHKNHSSLGTGYSSSPFEVAVFLFSDLLSSDVSAASFLVMFVVPSISNSSPTVSSVMGTVRLHKASIEAPNELLWYVPL